MICENCGKNPAQKFIRKAGGQEVVVELCPACYGKLYPEKENGFFADVPSAADGKACPSCGTTMAQFRSTGLLGCADCYTAFRGELVEAVRGMQGIRGEVRHTGKRPESSAEEKEEKYDRARDYAARREGIIERLEAAMRTGDYAAARQLQRELKALNARSMKEDV